MSLAPKGFLHIDRGKLEYCWYPPTVASDLSLVFLHEGLGCVSMWRDFPECLSKQTGLGTLVYSRFGYGASDSVEIPRPLTYMHQEALEFLPQVLDAAGIKRCVLVGHSDGASISIINAGGVKDPRVWALVLMAPHVFNETVSVTSIEQARDAYKNTDLREKLAKHHGNNVDCAFWGWNRAWLDVGFLAWNLEEYLPEINMPCLVMQGADDEYGTLAQVRAIKEKSGAAVTVSILSDCRHSPHRDQPNETLKGIESFLSTLPER